MNREEDKKRMKLIKIILGIVVTLTLIFFATGFVVNETKFVINVDIDQPVEVVFERFDNPQKIKEWLPNVKRITPINETANGTGSTYNFVVDNKGQEVKMKQKVKVFEKYKKVIYQFNSPEMIKIDSYTFENNKGKTHLTYNAVIRPTSFLLACTFPWFKSRFEKVSSDYLTDLKQTLEAQK